MGKAHISVYLKGRWRIYQLIIIPSPGFDSGIHPHGSPCLSRTSGERLAIPGPATKIKKGARDERAPWQSEDQKMMQAVAFLSTGKFSLFHHHHLAGGNKAAGHQLININTRRYQTAGIIASIPINRFETGVQFSIHQGAHFLAEQVINI